MGSFALRFGPSVDKVFMEDDALQRHRDNALVFHFFSCQRRLEALLVAGGFTPRHAAAGGKRTGNGNKAAF